MNWPRELTSTDLPVLLHSTLRVTLPALVKPAVFSPGGCAVPPPTIETLQIPFPLPRILSSSLIWWLPLFSSHSSIDTSQSLPWPHQTWIICSHSTIYLSTMLATAAILHWFLCLFDWYRGQGMMFGLAPCIVLVPRRVLSTQRELVNICAMNAYS